MSFCGWLISVKAALRSFVHTVTHNKLSSFMAGYYSLVCRTFSSSAHPLMATWVSLFILAAVSGASMSIRYFFDILILFLLCIYPVLGLPDHMIALLEWFFSNFSIHNACPKFPFSLAVSLSLSPRPYLPSQDLQCFITQLTVVLIFTSLIVSDNKLFFFKSCIY